MMVGEVVAALEVLLCMGLFRKFWVSPHPPGPDHADDSLATGMHVDVLHGHLLLASALGFATVCFRHNR
jgi:hypothetical protein